MGKRKQVHVSIDKIQEQERFIEAKDRTKAADTAPAKGLYLYKVNYK